MSQFPNPKEFREELGVTQKDLGDTFGISDKQVSKAENGDAPDMYFYALIGLASTLGGDVKNFEAIPALKAQIEELQNAAPDGDSSEELAKVTAELAQTKEELEAIKETPIERELKVVSMDDVKELIEQLFDTKMGGEPGGGAADAPVSPPPPPPVAQETAAPAAAAPRRSGLGRPKPTK